MKLAWLAVAKPSTTTSIYSALRFGAGLLTLIFTAANALAATIDNVRVGREPDHTRFVFDLSNPVEHQVFVQSSPDRLVIDLQDTRLRAQLDQVQLADTPVSAMRSAVKDKNDLRIVLDLKEPVKPRSFPLKKNEQYGDRLVVDLYDARVETVKSVDDVAVERDPDIIVAIDAGHGGKDPGAIGHKQIKEKHVVLAISRELKRVIDAAPGYRATLVRDGDSYIPLRRRTEIARSHRADLFISIHADGSNRPSARGASVFALSHRGATSERARHLHLAQRENPNLIGAAGSVGPIGVAGDVISLGGREETVAYALMDMSMAAARDRSLKVGKDVLKSIGGIARLHRKQVEVEVAGFVVLKYPNIPSILVETGFISNPGEARLLNQKGYQQKMARAIFNGVRQYFSTNPPAGTLIASRYKSDAREYIIAKGDTLSGIAARYNVSVERLLRHNGLKSTVIRVGQRLKIPAT